MSEPQLSGRWLLVLRCVWGLLAAGVLANFLVGIPAYYAEQTTICTTNLAQCAFNDQPTLATVAALHRLNLSLPVYASISTGFQVGVVLIFLGVGGLIFWRKSDTWLGLFTSLVLLVAGSISNNIPTVLVTSGPLLLPYGIFVTVLAFAAVVGIGVFLLTFPTGEVAPRWTWAVVLLEVALFISFVVPGPYNASHWPGILLAGDLLVTFGSLIAVQIYRYRRVYTPAQRQQTKWVVFGLAVGILIRVLSVVIGSTVPALNAPDSPYQLLNNFFSQAFFVSIPLTVGIAIMRYRLWDIDTIINRALVYGSLTGLLGVLYAVLIIGLESLAGVITRQTFQPIVLVISTLVIFALFLPLRRRLQATIDRRFYRRKYDAESILTSFSATLRNEVDLTELSQRLVDVVQETMQPERVSLWLRLSSTAKEPHTISR